MSRIPFFIILSLTIVIVNCDVWDLKKYEIPNFVQQDTLSIMPQFVNKHQLCQTKIGSYILSSAALNSQAYLHKLNENGGFIISKSFGNGIIHGLSTDPASKDTIFALMNAAGNSKILLVDTTLRLIKEYPLKPIFDKYQGLIQTINAYSLTIQNNGNLMITGQVKQTPAKEPFLFLLYLNKRGEYLKLIILNKSYLPGHITPVSDTSWVVSGQVFNSQNAQNRRLFVMLVTKSGRQVWQRVFNAYGDLGNSCVVFNQQVMVAASTLSNSPDINFLTLNINDGKEASNIKLGQANTKHIIGEIIKTRKDGLILWCSRANPSLSKYDLILYNLTPDGTVRWERLFPGSQFESPCSVIQTREFGFAAYSIFSNNVYRGLHMIKTDEEGIFRNQ